MKMYVRASESDFTNADLVQLLKDHNIDTTKQKYELRAEGYERYGSGKLYTRKFTCPGDWLAYLSMQFHKSPTADVLMDYFDDVDELIEFVEDYPTVQKIENHAASNWWGDGDDYIIYLKNLTTGKYLYESEEGEEEFEEEDWED